MGKTVEHPGESKKAWDSNAITPGTPFMDLLAASLRYWVVQKLNTDPGWKEARALFIYSCSVAYIPTNSFKFTSPMPVFPEKVNIRSWTSFAVNA
jgi:hypothetical protein